MRMDDVKEHAGNRPPRASGGRFAKGVSPNPNGRPKGAKNKTTLLVEQLIEDSAEKLTKKLIAMALKGSVTAMELVMNRLAPVRRDRPVVFELPAIESLDDIEAAHGAILHQMATGVLTPSETKTIAELLDLRRQAIVALDHASRIAALEAASSPPH